MYMKALLSEWNSIVKIFKELENFPHNHNNTKDLNLKIFRQTYTYEHFVKLLLLYLFLL